jgi:hypothetical protein
VIDVRVEVDGVVSHGVDGAFLFRELQLKVFQLGCAEIDANNGAFVQAIVAFEALPPQVRYLHTKADQRGGPFLIDGDALANRRRHRGGG